ncbi:hypothetical protein SLA2020_513470 [Shorea laevis]
MISPFFLVQSQDVGLRTLSKPRNFQICVALRLLPPLPQAALGGCDFGLFFGKETAMNSSLWLKLAWVYSKFCCGFLNFGRFVRFSPNFSSAPTHQLRFQLARNSGMDNFL